MHRIVPTLFDDFVRKEAILSLELFIDRLLRFVDFSVLACSHLDIVKGTDMFIFYPTEFAKVDHWLRQIFHSGLAAQRVSNKDVNCLRSRLF